MKTGPKQANQINSIEQCSFGCGKIAKFLSHSGRLMCESSANKCIENRKRNSQSQKKGHIEGKISSFSLEAQARGRKTAINNRLQRTKWLETEAPWEIIPTSRKRNRIMFEQDNHCAICKCEPIWNNQILKFHLDHIHGKQYGNKRENLRLICPNCHSQTSTYCSKNASYEGKQKIKEALRRGSITARNNERIACSKMGQGSVKAPLRHARFDS